MHFRPPWYWFHSRVALIVNRRLYFLHAHRRTHIMIQVSAGHSVDCSIEYLDQNGNPMLTMPTPDTPPVWTNDPSALNIDTLTVSPDGSTAVLATNASDANATDMINLVVTVGGKTFNASLSVAISAAPQVLTSVAIDGVVQ